MKGVVVASGDSSRTANRTMEAMEATLPSRRREGKEPIDEGAEVNLVDARNTMRAWKVRGELIVTSLPGRRFILEFSMGGDM
ncbi:hypothetical protein E2562_010346 [Oryza meyeriana var. granulata]|uniref:Uncharacterized protein n=1 Tax=Oryza meyeriana var. granulata TaxID=110450 RepID=A0A6G1F696_9ORYZ|nr:hypothetical protein E2562_010346 [Oryza meyeriana var. granulata]